MIKAAPPAFLRDPVQVADAAYGFREAIHYINTYGWFQGDWFLDSLDEGVPVGILSPFPDGCSVCLMGAMAVVSGNSLSDAFNTDRYNNMERYATYRFMELTGQSEGMMAEWNDDAGTEKEDVLDFLETLAVELERLN